MTEQKFAFETGKVSIAFILRYGLGDCIIAKKVFDALTEIEPDCAIDIFYKEERHRAFAATFYSDSRNLNIILSQKDFYKKLVENYDLSLNVAGGHFTRVEYMNSRNLKEKSPALLGTVNKINKYNEQNFGKVLNSMRFIALRNMLAAQILHKNFFHFLSCDGVLPLREDKLCLSLLLKYKPEFDKLNLGNYITIYTNINERHKEHPKIKTWSADYLVEYVTILKKHFPKIEIVQTGGEKDVKVKNADRHFLGVDLELTKYILANSLLHVGCEGGLIHLATQLGTKCVVIFGPTCLDYYGYSQNINLSAEVCNPCMFVLGNGGTRVCSHY